MKANGPYNQARYLYRDSYLQVMRPPTFSTRPSSLNVRASEWCGRDFHYEIDQLDFKIFLGAEAPAVHVC